MGIKDEFLRLLREDEEFRLAVAGLLGLDSILRELKALREDFNKYMKAEEERWKENEKRWEENNKRWEENWRRWEENEKRWEENWKRLEAIEEEIKRMREEQGKVWNEINKVWGEINKLWQEVKRQGDAIEALVKSVEKLTVQVGSLGNRFGRGFEDIVRKWSEDLLKSLGIEGLKVSRFKYHDIRGEYGPPNMTYEVDMYVSDEKLYLIEIKSFADVDDVEWFFEKCNVVERILGRKASRRIILAMGTNKEAIDTANSLGIELVYSFIGE